LDYALQPKGDQGRSRNKPLFTPVYQMLANFLLCYNINRRLSAETKQDMLKARAASVTQIILFAAIFAALQIVAVNHNTVYGDVGHTHDDTSCVFQITSDSAQDTTTASGNNPSDVVFPIHYVRLKLFRRFQPDDYANSIRAPPPISPIQN
jgi:hypothetical protein